MPFVRYSADGQIVAVSQSGEAGCDREVTSDDPALQQYLEELRGRSLAETDQGFIRVIEDVVDLLVEKGVFKLDELPPDACDKILQRKSLRQARRRGGH